MGLELSRHGVRVVRRMGVASSRLAIPLASTALAPWGPSWHEALGTPASRLLMGQRVGGCEAAACLLRLARSASETQWGRESVEAGTTHLVCADFDSSLTQRELLEAARIAQWPHIRLAPTSWAASHLVSTQMALTLNLTWDSLDIHVMDKSPTGWIKRDELSVAGAWGEWLGSLTVPGAPLSGLDEMSVCEQLNQDPLNPSLGERVEAAWLHQTHELSPILTSWVHKAALGRGEDLTLVWLGPIARPAQITRVMSDLTPLASWQEGQAAWMAPEGAAWAASIGAMPPATQLLATRGPLGVKVSRRIAHRLHHGYFSPLLPAGAAPGATKRATFSTVAAHQQSISLEVLEGQSRLSSENTPLGRLVLEDIPPDEKPQDLLVDFEMAPAGGLKVSARMAKSGQRVSARFEEGRPLSDVRRVVDILTGTL